MQVYDRCTRACQRMSVGKTLRGSSSWDRLPWSLESLIAAVVFGSAKFLELGLQRPLRDIM